MIIEHNVETGEILKREMNAEELAQLETRQAQAQAQVTAQQEAEAAKVAATAKLAALGLTIDDLKALGLGGN